MDKSNRDKLALFVQDPNWKIVEDYFKTHIEPLKDVMTIDDSQTAESVLAEVKARKKTINSFTGFLEGAKALLYQKEQKKQTFK